MLYTVKLGPKQNDKILSLKAPSSHIELAAVY